MSRVVSPSPLQKSLASGLWIVGLALAMACAGCAAGRPLPSTGAAPGTWRVSVGALMNGDARSYLLHVPTRYRAGRDYPLVVVLHVAFSTACEMEEWTGWSALANREGFVVAYPEGGWGILGWLQHWNAGHCCGKRRAVVVTCDPDRRMRPTSSRLARWCESLSPVSPSPPQVHDPRESGGLRGGEEVRRGAAVALGEGVDLADRPAAHRVHEIIRRG